MDDLISRGRLVHTTQSVPTSEPWLSLQEDGTPSMTSVTGADKAKWTAQELRGETPMSSPGQRILCFRSGDLVLFLGAGVDCMVTTAL